MTKTTTTTTMATTEKRVTKRDNFNKLLSIPEVMKNQTLVDFINHEIELLDKKSSKSGGQTKNQLANEVIKSEIVSTLSELNKPVTVSELMTAGVIHEKGYTNQKLSSLLRQLILENKVVRTTEKKKAYFAVA